MRHCKGVVILVAVISFIDGNVNGQAINLGSCQKVQVKQNFDAGRYTGRWYEAERIVNTFQLGGSCVTADYALEEDDHNVLTGNIIVKNSMSNWYGKTTNITGLARPLDKTSSEAKLLVSFKGVPTEGSYWVLDTDYDTYSVVYSCTEVLGLFNFKFLWLLTRSPKVSESTQEYMQEVLRHNGLSSYLLTKTNQKNCNYTPLE